LGFWPGRFCGAFREGLFSRCCLTITSEERETWAAGSLRGFVIWVGFRRELRFGLDDGVRRDN
jgi:hypothetical protein